MIWLLDKGCTDDDRKALDRLAITSNEIQVLLKCDVECRGEPFVPSVLPCFKPTTDRIISQKCSQCMDEVFSCGIGKCRDKCGGIHPDKTEIKICLLCWDHECARDEVDECGVYITDTYFSILSKAW